MHLKVTSFLMNFCIIYMCFHIVSLNSPSVSKPASFKVVCALYVFWLSSLQNSIQNIHDFSFLNLPLPVVTFGLGSMLLCVSMMGRCLCSFPPPPPSLLVAGQFLVSPPQLLLAVATNLPSCKAEPLPCLSHKKHTSTTGPKSWCIMHSLCLQI